ncbi:MAG: 1-acyl-sn-glycerol-3-phosphate acyltransferase [Granulosicoccus sp.]|nr:1-acyl-sn-glycerol-3-phosphate acyltransferase [Granulosicoccus sp.]
MNLSSTITLPLWALILIGILAAFSLLHHFLLPSVRWVFRRRANRVIDEVNQRLALTLPSFKLTKREVLIDRLIYDARVMAAAEEISVQEQVPRDAVMVRVRQYAREIVPAFNAFLYFKCGYWIARRLVHLLYRVRLGFADDASLAKLGNDSSVVFLMNHRSNMDYILATYLAAERTALSYAVGEWARVWPLQQLIRLMGGYFVRRNSGDPLYRRVLESYVQMAAEGGVPQAIFLEGGLSRTGRLGSPKLGLLGYLTKDFTQQNERDIVFVPVGINYDRVLEDRTLIKPRKPGSSAAGAGTFFTAAKTVQYLFNNLWLALTGRWYRNGYACVNFGSPVSLRAWNAQRVRTQSDSPWEQDVEALASDLMKRVGAVVPILPVALVATVFQSSSQEAGGTQLSKLELKNHLFSLVDTLTAAGRHVYIPRGDMDYAVDVGIRMLTLRHILLDHDGVLSVNPREWTLLNFYAASIEHFLAPDNILTPQTASSTAESPFQP